ncbi:MAG: phenylalanine--tRNA ligase subunit beta [archaeon]
MPTITINKKALLDIVGKKLTDAQLKERLAMLGTDLEEMKGNEIIIEIFPNRPDMLSEQGLGRALASFLGRKTGLRKYEVKNSGHKVIVHPSVNTVRPFTACAIVKNLKFDNQKIKEIIQIQEKLHVSFGRNRKRCAIGIYPLEHIKMPITYQALEPKKIKFVPLESNKEMDGRQILRDHPAGREYAHLLDGHSKYPIFVDAKGDILSMPPIINSHKTGRITSRTKEVFIECSGFDFRILEECLNMIVTTLADMGGKIYSMEVACGNKKCTTPDLNPKKMKLDIDYINKRLGLDLSEAQARRCLEKMGYGYEKKQVLIPAYRTDILHQVDLAEDIAISYGYENFKEEIPCVASIGWEDPLYIFANKVREILVGHGLIEVKNYCLTDSKIQKDKMNTNLTLVRIKNPLSKEYDVMRAWLIPGLIHILQEYKHHEYPHDIFEVGHIFKVKPQQDTGVLEDVRVAVTLCNPEADYTKIKQIFDSLMGALDLEYEINDTDHPSFIAGRVGRISVNKQYVAYMGEIHPEILDNFDLKMPVATFELNLTELLKVMEKNKK